MDERPSLSELIARYRDGLASEAEREELAERIRSHPQAADRFARAARTDAWLAGHFRQQRAASTAEALVDRATDPAAERIGVRRWSVRAAAAAAAILSVGGLALWALHSWTSRPETGMVLAGRVLVEGQPSQQIAGDSRFRVADRAPAVVRLADGSRVEFEPASAAVLHGPTNGVQQEVELLDGGGTFRVEKGQGRFVVRTAWGRVTVLGTEFRINLVPEDSGLGEGVEPMNVKQMLLAVAVLAGTVQVEVGGRTFVLGSGDSRVFAEERENRSRTRSMTGELTKVAGDAMTLTQRGDSGAKSVDFTMTPKTEILVETDQMETVKGEGGRDRQRPKLAKGSAADLKVGKRVRVTAGEDGTATRILIHRPRTPKSGGESGGRAARVRFLTGQLGKVQGNSLTIIRRHEGRDDSQTVTLGAKVAILVETDQMETVKQEGGKDLQRRKIVAGKASDLKAGAWVTATWPEGGEMTRLHVHVARPPAPRSGGEGERRTRTVTGELTRIDAKSLTVTRSGDSGNSSQDIAVAAAVEVSLETDKTETVKSEGGRDRTRPVVAKGGPTDLKTGQRVRVTLDADGKAVKVYVYRPRPPKESNER